MIRTLCMIITLGMRCRQPAVHPLPLDLTINTNPCTITRVPNGTCPDCVDLVLAPTCTADDIFVNAAAGDFHLIATSPAIDQAICTALVLTDFDGNPRPTPGRGCDVGAYQFIGPNPGPPSAPTGLTVTSIKEGHQP